MNLFRICVVYVEGGWYSDWKQECLEKFYWKIYLKVLNILVHGIRDKPDNRNVSKIVCVGNSTTFHCKGNIEEDIVTCADTTLYYWSLCTK